MKGFQRFHEAPLTYLIRVSFLALRLSEAGIWTYRKKLFSYIQFIPEKPAFPCKSSCIAPLFYICRKIGRVYTRITRILDIARDFFSICKIHSGKRCKKAVFSHNGADFVYQGSKKTYISKNNGAGAPKGHAAPLVRRTIKKIQISLYR